ncbi:MAG: DUF362 domain-containing protein [Candidatus Eisenbacteria bacterium]|nr:DUF362 domain-containing protein [Candidatus Eisenbacteria bacterium]
MDRAARRSPRTGAPRTHSSAPDRGRRDFLRTSTLAALAALGSRASALGAADPMRQAPLEPANLLPGRIVLLREPEMDGHLETIDEARVASVVHQGVRVLANKLTTASAFESLFPGLTSTSKIAIKVNCIGPCDTRWETVRGIVSGLAQMLSSTYDVSQVTIFDRDLSDHGYTADRFTFNGRTAALRADINPGSYYPYGSYRLSSYILNADHLIDVPVLKSHSDTNNQITVALKNHYGSCFPSSLCGNIPGMLTVNADQHIKGKTRLVITDAIRGTYNGGPGEPAQNWNTFPEQKPNTLFFATDPVTNEYWARDMINDERQSRGWSTKPCPWIEQASGAPYNLGVSNPAQMTVISMNAADVPGETETQTGTTFLAPSVPNPFRERTSIRFRMGHGGLAAVAIYDVSGRLVRDLGERSYGEGYATVPWDGRDADGRAVAAGVYLARLSTDSGTRSRRLVRSR